MCEDAINTSINNSFFTGCFFVIFEIGITYQHFALYLTQTLLKHLELLEWGSQHYESLFSQNIISL